MKAFSIFIGLIVTFEISCFSQQNHQYFDNSILVDTNNIPLNPKTSYFPASLMPRVKMIWKKKSNSSFEVIPNIIKNSIDSSAIEWYSRFLYAMKEPLLYNRQFDMMVFRFTWLRSFDHPVIIRIEEEASGIFLYWKVSDGEGGYEPGSIIINGKRQIELGAWTRFKTLVDSVKFWEMQRSGNFGTDGSEWILEGVGPTNYHVTSVWSPGKQSEIYEICNSLLKQTRMEIIDEEKY